MHEASIAQSLLEQVRRCLPTGARPLEIHIDIGEMEHIDGPVLEAAWSVISEHSSCAGARLRISWTPVTVRCRTCGTEHAPDDQAIMVCPGCGAARPEVLTGNGIMLMRVEAECSPADESTSRATQTDIPNPS